MSTGEMFCSFVYTVSVSMYQCLIAHSIYNKKRKYAIHNIVYCTHAKDGFYMFDAQLIFSSMEDTYFKTDEKKRER